MRTVGRRLRAVRQDVVRALGFTPCSCGRVYSAHTFTTLAFVGIQDDFAGGALDLRNCSCGSTIAREVPRG